ncbi:MAG: sortase domain-bontaining protein [Marmoricola sp.]
MTVVAQRSVPSAPADPPAPAAGPAGPPSVLSTFLTSATAVLAMLLLGFVATVVVLGPVTHARAQSVQYQDLRRQLANSVAPTGQLDATGQPLALGDPVALLQIPAIGLREVVGEGTTSGVLMDGPGHRRDTPLPGQAGIAVVMGRQATYGGPFGKLHDLKPGDQITATTGQGRQQFQVTGVRHAGDKLTIKDVNASHLMLVTGGGTPYLSSSVLYVDADLVGKPQPAAARTISTALLSKGEQQMVGDKGALLPLLLWSQLLLLVVGGVTWLRSSWAKWQAWVVAVPVIGIVGYHVDTLVAQLLPNLL